MVICLQWGANDLHMVQLMPLPPHHLSLHKNLEWFTSFLVPAYPGCPGKEANEWASVCHENNVEATYAFQTWLRNCGGTPSRSKDLSSSLGGKEPSFIAPIRYFSHRAVFHESDSDFCTLYHVEMVVMLIHTEYWEPISPHLGQCSNFKGCLHKLLWAKNLKIAP